jgi:hypothetical protein
MVGLRLGLGQGETRLLPHRRGDGEGVTVLEANPHRPLQQRKAFLV